MSDPYLICHIVRGSPAFDIAERIGEDSDGDIWIIPTSGHRAYPYWFHTLEHLHIALLPDGNWAHGYTEHEGWDHLIPIPPTNWPDHYACNDRPLPSDPSRPKIDLVAALGLTPKTKIVRRV